MTKEAKKVEKTETAKVIEDSKKSVSDVELSTMLDNINMDAVIEKSAKNRSIWTDKAKSTFGKTEKSARRKLRTLQLSLSSSVVRFAKLNDKAGLKGASLNLQKFYTNHLVDQSIYTNVSIENNPVNYQILTTAYKLMKQSTK